jgi:hypothetical protein
VAAQLVASRAVLSSIELVSQSVSQTVLKEEDAGLGLDENRTL